MSIFRKSVDKIQVSLKSDKSAGTLHEDQALLSISRSVLLRMRNVSDISRARLTIVRAGSMHRRERKRIQDFSLKSDQPRGLVVRVSDY